MVGTRLGPFEIAARLDLPGLGEVYRARDHEHGREVALHVIRADFERDQPLRERLERDLRAAASLTHPNVPAIYDAGFDAHAAYVISEPIEGEPLRGRLDRGALTLGEALRCAVAVGRARRALHRQGVRHVRVSPHTVFLTGSGRVMLLGAGMGDFVPALPPAGWEPGLWARPAAVGAGVLLLVALAAGVFVFLPRESPPQPAAPAVVVSSAPPAPVAPAGDVPVVDVPVVPPPEDSEPGASPTPGGPAAVVETPRMPPVAAPPAPPAPLAVPAPAAGPAAPPPALPPALPTAAAAPPTAPTPPEARAPAAPAPAPARGEVRPVPSTDGRDPATLYTEATVRTEEFDLDGALDLLPVAAARGDSRARAAAVYLRGLVDARESFRQGGSAESLKPVHEAIAALGDLSQGRPGAAEIARLMLHAAAAAAQSERDEMRLYIESATQMEALQQTAGFDGAPLVPAAELAGELWLQVHQYEAAQEAYQEASARAGENLRTRAGLARVARRLNDRTSACSAYRKLIGTWGGRPGLPLEIAEARAYLGGCVP